MLATAQDDSAVGAELEVGYLLGGQVTTNSFSFHSGFSGRFSVTKKLSSNFKLGLGAGLDQYDRLSFVPVFALVEAKAKENSVGAFRAYGGYSFGEGNQDLTVNQEVEGRGFLEIGRSWKYPINEKLYFTFLVSFKHQFSVVETTNFIGQEFEEKTDFTGAHFRVGIGF